MKYNEKNNIIPQQIVKAKKSVLIRWQEIQESEDKKYYTESEKFTIAAEPVVKYMSTMALKKAIENSKHAMKKASKELDYIEAARLRDEMMELQKLLDERSNN